VGWMLEMNRKLFFQFLVAGAEGFKMNLNFEWKFLNFLKDRNLEIGQGSDSNKFELKFGIFQNLIRRLNQGIWSFDETNSNSNLEFVFKGKEIWHSFRHQS
jgi:hypothetical protein